MLDRLCTEITGDTAQRYESNRQRYNQQTVGSIKQALKAAFEGLSPQCTNASPEEVANKLTVDEVKRMNTLAANRSYPRGISLAVVLVDLADHDAILRWFSFFSDLLTS